MSKTENNQNKTIENRYEIVFLYDVKDANPNGDPDDDNNPRLDGEGVNIVTDVRLKRTIRDYWLDKYQDADGKKILVQRVENVADGTISNMSALILKALDIKEGEENKGGKVRQKIRKIIPEKYIDVRFFGAAITLKGANTSITGPVQFGIGRSLNKPEIKSYTITTTFASTEGKGQGTFGETNGVDYSLIGFEGVISEYRAKHTGLTEKDISLLQDGLWDGTKNLNTRSKFNHSPRLMVFVKYKKENFQIGGLKRLLEITNVDAKSESDVILVLDRFVDRLVEFKDCIEEIHLKEDSLLNCNYKDKETTLKEKLTELKFKVVSI